MRELINRIKNVAKLAMLTLNTNDEENYPQAQFTYLGKVADIPMIFPYGLTARPPEGKQTLALVIQIQGQENNRVAIPYAPLMRTKGLKAGEAILENMVAGGFIKCDAEGNVIITAENDVIVKAASNVSVEAQGDATVTAANITATAQVAANIVAPVVDVQASASVSLTSPTVTINGNLAVTGSIVQAGKDIGQAHTHSGVTTGTGNTGGVN